jgi:tetratricopeptide (TPR) repeat protein
LLYLDSLPLVFLSLLAKETAIFFPLVLIVWDICAGHNLIWRGRLLRCVGLLFVIAVYLWLRHYAMGGELYLYEGRIQPLATFSWFLNAIPTVMTSLFFPMNPHFPLSQHHLYLPSMVIFTLVAAIFHLLARKVTMRYALLGIILISVLLGGITFRHNSIWRDELILSERALETAPGHPVALWLLGESYLPRGRSPEAIELFKKTLALNQANPRIHESLGLASRLLHKPTKALVHYQRAALLAPDHPYYHWITARHYRRMKRFGEAEVYFSNAAGLNPRSSDLRNDVAYSYYIQGKNDDSIAELKEALKVLPYSSTLKENLAQALKRKKLQSRGGSKNP